MPVLVKSPPGPSTRDRNSSCTHLHLTRLYDQYGCDSCSMCHRRPPLGWLYRCTQDFDNFLPASDFYDVEDCKRFDYDAQLYTLSPSVTKAAQHGHYTDHELDVLWKQKIEVRRTIRQIRPNTSSSASTTSSSQYSLPASTTTSTIPSSHSGTDPDIYSDFNQSSEYAHPCRAPLEAIQEVHDHLEREPFPFAKPCLPPPCNFKVCQTCRPIFKDRAWESIDRVLTSPYKPPPRHELLNRRISDVNIVRQLDLGGHDKSGRVDLDRSQKNNRTEFQDTVQRLLRQQDFVEDNSSNLLCERNYRNLASLVKENINGAISSDTSSHDNFSPLKYHDVNKKRPALFNRRGFERFTSIEVPTRSSVSHCGDSGTSPGLSTNQSTVSSPAILQQKPAIEQMQDNQENMPPTPTESIGTVKKTLLSRMTKPSKSPGRFIID